MKRSLCILLTAVMLLCFPLSARAYSARSMVLLEHTTKTVVDSVDCDKKLPMASTTKIMTALVTIESIPLDTVVSIPSAACGIEGSSLYLIAGEKMTVRDLLYGLLLKSGNDAAAALAITVGGSVDAFVEMMNKKASALGLKNTHFTNPSGLPDDAHYTTAYELALITCAALNDPTFAQIVSTTSARIPYNNTENGRLLTNHNKLLTMYDYAVGVKTGFTKKAGRCLVSAAKKDGVTLVCVTLNAPDDWNDHITAFEYGFSRVGYTCVAKAGEITASLKTPDGKTVVAKNAEDVFSITFDNVVPTQKIYADSFVYAPKAKGQTVAYSCFYVNGTLTAKTDLSLLEPLEIQLKKQSLLLTIINYIKGLFK